MNLQLAEKVFIVTGGSKGIGEGITRALVAEGAIPVIATRSKEATQNLLGELQGNRIHAIIGDLASEGQCKRVVEETLSAFGRIDGIVNNAGVNDGVELEQGSPEAFRLSLQTMIKSRKSIK